MDVYTRIHNRTSEKTRQKVRTKMNDIMNTDPMSLDETDEFLQYFYDNAILEMDSEISVTDNLQIYLPVSILILRLKNLWVSKHAVAGPEAFRPSLGVWSAWQVQDNRIKRELLYKGSIQQLKHLLKSIPEFI